MRPADILHFAAAAGVLSLAPAARAAVEAPCRVVEAFNGVPVAPAWRHALDAVEADLASSPAWACRGVTLTVSWQGEGVRVAARAGDGRETIRVVGAPAALTAVAFGLLATAPAEAPLPEVDVHELPPPSAPAPVIPSIAPFDVVSRLDVGAAAGVRVGFPTNVVMADIEARADVFIHRWLVSVSMRAAPLSASSRLPADIDAYQETALALGLGRELRAGASAFDLTAGPNFTYIWMENDVQVVSTTQAQLRIAALARWGYPVSRHVRLNTTVDAEVAPSALINGTYLTGLAPFPAFTLGLRLGAEGAL